MSFSASSFSLLLLPRYILTADITVFYPETKGKTLEELDYIFIKEEDRPTQAVSHAEVMEKMENQTARSTVTHVEKV